MPFARGIMRRLRVLHFLLALALLNNVARAQQIDWENVVFTAIANAQNGCVLTAGYNVIKRNFFLKDCQVVQDLVFPATGHVRGIEFTSGRDGWLMFGSGLVPFTDGETGKAPKIGDEDWLFVGVSFYDEANGCSITSDGHIACTSDGGKTWASTQPKGIVDGFGITFASEKTVWASVSTKGSGAGRECRTIMKSVDAGKNWSPVENLPKCDIYLVGFIDEFYAWAVRSNNQLLVTRDGAKSWQTVGSVPGQPDDIFFLTPSTGWLIVDRKLYGTADGGHSWKKLWKAPEMTLVNPRGLLFVNELNGWLMSLEKLYRTANGGKTWKRVSPSR